ncbi:MAG: Uma2 family endonuclease [Eubacterium sp.]|nr:Uma2 family endonuclease [Eubacterium sp.]
MNKNDYEKPDRSGNVREAYGDYSALKDDRLYTIEDYYALPDDERFELIDGRLYKMYAPSGVHQFILGELHILFYDCIRDHNMPCQVLFAPFDVRLDCDDYTMVQPDLMVFCHDFDLGMRRYEGAPDLVIEILSPSTRMKDLLLKLRKYRQAGVREYWIVDPENRTVTVHPFEESDYRPQNYTFDDEIPVAIAKGICRINFSGIAAQMRKLIQE